MSFTMSNIKRKMPTKKDDIKYCYAYIYGNDLLTDNIKLALWKYVEFRISKHQVGRLQNSIKRMIEDLLVNICNKSKQDITFSDVYEKENDILYQIKRAIIYGATVNLYYDKFIIDLDTINIKFVRKPPERHLSEEETIDYFGDLMI